jgi:hypothetical protein
VHNSLNEDPNKAAEESTTVTHKYYNRNFPSWRFMTGGVVTQRDSHLSHVIWPNGRADLYYNINLSEDKKMPTIKTLTYELPVFTQQESSVLLAMISLLGKGYVAMRTDVIGNNAGMTPPVMAAVGLQLRSKGIISSTNDGQKYNYWSFNSELIKDTVSKRYSESVSSPTVPAATKQTEWIVWSPESNLPPRVKHSCEQEAMAVAESMAKRHPTQSFYACEVHAGFKVTKVKKERVVIDTVDKMEQL